MELLVHHFCPVVADVGGLEVANDLVLAVRDDDCDYGCCTGPMHDPHL